MPIKTGILLSLAGLVLAIVATQQHAGALAIPFAGAAGSIGTLTFKRWQSSH